MNKNFTSLAYLQNYRQLNITRVISTNPKPHILTTVTINLSNALPHTQHTSLLQLRRQLCRSKQAMLPPPASWPFDLESGVRVTCEVAYLHANFSLPRPLFSWLRSDVNNRHVKHIS